MAVTTNWNSNTKRVTEKIREEIGNNELKSNMFLRRYLDHWDRLASRIESRLENSFSIAINCMSFEMLWEEERKCSATAVGLEGLDLVLELSGCVHYSGPLKVHY